MGKWVNKSIHVIEYFPVIKKKVELYVFCGVSARTMLKNKKEVAN